MLALYSSREVTRAAQLLGHWLFLLPTLASKHAPPLWREHQRARPYLLGGGSGG